MRGNQRNFENGEYHQGDSLYKKYIIVVKSLCKKKLKNLVGKRKIFNSTIEYNQAEEGNKFVTLLCFSCYYI